VALCIAASAVLLLAACGGGSRLSQSAYRTKLAQVKQEAASAQASVAQGLQAKTLAELRGRLDAFAESTQRISDEVAKLKPPQNAEAANTELADGLHETARAARDASKAVAGLHTPREAITYLEQSPLNKKGARQVDEALTRLKQLGYTSGS
jgi:uncharacterized lipoprotein